MSFFITPILNWLWLFLKKSNDQSRIIDRATLDQIQNQDSSFDYSLSDRKFRSWKKIFYNSSYPSFYWVFVSISDEAVVFKPIQAMLHRSILLIVVFVLLVAIAGYIIADSISRPILALTRNARLISQGNHNVTFNKTRGNDEIKELTESFEGMVYSLKEVNARFSAIVTYAVDGILTVNTSGFDSIC